MLRCSQLAPLQVAIDGPQGPVAADWGVLMSVPGLPSFILGSEPIPPEASLYGWHFRVRLDEIPAGLGPMQPIDLHRLGGEIGARLSRSLGLPEEPVVWLTSFGHVLPAGECDGVDHWMFLVMHWPGDDRVARSMPRAPEPASC